MESQRKLMGIGEGLHRLLDLIYQFRSVTTTWQQDIRTGAAAELNAISVFCNSKIADLYSRAAYGTPGAVAALSYLEGRILKQQTVLQQCVTYPKLLEAWHTKLLGNVLAELRGAFALSLVSATTELVLAPVMNPAGHSAYLTADGTPVSIHALVEVLHRNLHTIRHISNSSTQQQLYEAAVLLPMQREPQPRKEEATIINQIIKNLLNASSTTLLDPKTLDVMVDPVVCSDGRTHCRWEAFKIMDSPCNAMPGCAAQHFKVVHDNDAARSAILKEHPAQERESARRRACYLDDIDSLVAAEDLITASSHIQRALQWMSEGSPEQQALQQKLLAIRQAAVFGTQLCMPVDAIRPPSSALGPPPRQRVSPPPEEVAARCFRALNSEDLVAARQATFGIAAIRHGQMQLRAALVDAGAVPLLSAATAAAAEVDIERSTASARALEVLAAGDSSCRAAVATTSVATSLVCLLQNDVRDETLWRVSRIAGATALALAVSSNLAAAAAASAQGATRLLARMIDTGMHNDLRAPALLGLAALAAAGQADGVAAEVLHGPNFIGQNQILRALGCGTAVVAATASLIRELAVRGSPDLMNALLQHGSATLLAHVLAQPLAVAWAGPGNVATLQHRALTALKALAAAGGDPCALLPAALASLPAEGQAIAASAAAVAAQLAAAPASPAALVATDVAGRLLAAALRTVDSAAAAAAAANKTPAAADMPPAGGEAPAPVQQHGCMFSPEVQKADCSPTPPPPSVVATALHGLAELAAAGEAEAVARQILCGSGTSPMDIDQLLSVLRCGVDACVAMAALVWALAARGGETMARLLLRREASTFLVHLLDDRPQVAHITSADLPRLRQASLVALQALAAAGARARTALLARWWTLRAVVRVLAAPNATNAACAVGLLSCFVAAPAFPEALGPQGAAALAAALQRGIRQPEPGAAAAASNLAAAAAAHGACREALLGDAGVAAALRDAADFSPDAALRAAAAAALAALAAPLPPPAPPGSPVSVPDEAQQQPERRGNLPADEEDWLLVELNALDLADELEGSRSSSAAWLLVDPDSMELTDGGTL